jgi:zinc transporter ZupT
VALAFAGLVAAATIVPFVAGLVPILGRAIDDRALHGLLGLAAGMMVGVAFLRVFPRTFTLGGTDVALTLGAPFIALYVLEGAVGVHGHSSHDHAQGHEPGDHFAGALSEPRPAIATLGVHMFLDGIVLAAGFAVSTQIGLATGIAIVGHKIPAGFATGTILAAGDTDRPRRLLVLAGVVLSTAIGAIAGLGLAGVDGLVPHLLALAGGTLLFVAVAELLPEIHHGPHKARVTTGLVLGFAAIWALGFAIAALA